MRKIIEASTLRSKVVEAFDEQFVCTELSGSESMEFSQKLKANREVAFAWLFLNKVRKPDGTIAFTPEEATQISMGGARAFMPLFLAITGFADPEKKASEPQKSSTTDSPSPSDEPSESSSPPQASAN